MQVKVGTSYSNILTRSEDNFFVSNNLGAHFPSGLPNSFDIRVYAVDGQYVDDTVNI